MGAALSGRISQTLVTPAGLDDPEHPDAQTGGLQRQLLKLYADAELQQFEQQLEAAGDLSELRKLKDLRHKDTDHAHLWEVVHSRGTRSAADCSWTSSVSGWRVLPVAGARPPPRRHTSRPLRCR